MVYDLEKVYKANVDDANKNIENCNDLSNELTRQILTSSTFLLIFISTVIIQLKDKMHIPINLYLIIVPVNNLFILVVVFSFLSIMMGLFSLRIAAKFLLEKAKISNTRAIQTQKFISDFKKIESSTLPYEYDPTKGPESSCLERVLSWGNITFFVVAVMLGLITIISVFSNI